MRLDGSAIDMAVIAARTLSRASETALSGSPTIENAGKPAVTAHCTSTMRASTPSKATV